jgi:nitroimidazol reductase NimA-like FMN-containing flavoprotein (pyridoxamine 5'-phosphate oxidase superfamily)
MANDQSKYAPTDRTRIRRYPARGTYDRATVHAILDEALVCHLAFAVGDQHQHQPTVLPTAFVRDDETIYVHGSAKNGLLSALAGGAPACVAVTLVDGLVLARSAFHHSMNYRSVVIFGAARELTGAEKARAFHLLVDKLSPGRSTQARPASEREMALTMVLAIPLEEVSAKVRRGGPIDDADDMALPVWAGVVPLALRAGAPVVDGVGLHQPPAVPAPLIEK